MRNNLASNPQTQDRYRAIIFLVGAAILWSLGGLLIKLVSWNPIAIAGTRSAIAAVVILAFTRRKNLSLSPVQVGGAFAYAATVILFVTANKLTTSANAILLQYTAPVYAALLGSWFLGERTRKIDWIIIFIVLGGMLLFFLDHLSAGGMWGNICAILSGVAFAGLAVLMRKQKNESPLGSILLGNILTALIGLPFMFGPMPDLNGWVALLLLGVVQLGFSYILYAIAIKHVTALEAILIPIVEPILNPIWVFLAFGEVPGLWAVVGGLIVLVAVTARCVIVTVKDRAI